MGTYSTRKRMVAVSRRKSRTSTNLFQEGTPSPPSKVITNARTSPRFSKTAGSRRESCNTNGGEQKANFIYYANTILASPSKNKLGKPCTGFTTKETNRMTKLTKYSKDRIGKMIAELGKQQMSTSASQKYLIGAGRPARDSSTMQPRKLTYHRRVTQFSSKELINVSEQIEQVRKLQNEIAAGAKTTGADDRYAKRMDNFPGFKIKQLLKSNSLDQVIACHIQKNAREQIQQMIRCQTILKNVGTEIIELDSEEDSVERLPEPMIENESKASKLLPLAALMMAEVQNRQHEEDQQTSHSDPPVSTSPQPSTGMQELASSSQLFQNGIKIENNDFSTGAPYQSSKRMIIWTKEGKYSVVTHAGGKEQIRFAIPEVFAYVGEGTPDDPVVINDD